MNKENLKKVNLSKAYRNWYYCIVGAGGDLQEWIEGYEKWLAEQQIGWPTEWYYCYGSDINKKYKLTGTNKYDDDLVFLFFPTAGLDMSRLAVFKIRLNDHWFADIIDDKLFQQKMGI